MKKYIVFVLLISCGGYTPSKAGSCVDWASDVAPRGIDFKVAVEMCRQELRAGRAPCMRRSTTVTGGNRCLEVVQEGNVIDMPLEAP